MTLPQPSSYEAAPSLPVAPESVLVHHVRDTLPFVVRLSPLRFAWLSGLRLMIFFGVLGVAVGIFLVAVTGDVAAFAIAAMFVLIALLVMPFLGLEVRKHPVLGADEAGIWVKVLRAHKAVFLPWDAVAQVTIGKFGTHHELCVVARDSAVDAALSPVARGNAEQRVGQAIVNRRSRAKLGTNIHTPLTGAQFSHEEVLAKLRYYAAGRCPVG